MSCGVVSGLSLNLSNIAQINADVGGGGLSKPFGILICLFSGVCLGSLQWVYAKYPCFKTSHVLLM